VAISKKKSSESGDTYKGFKNKGPVHQISNPQISSTIFQQIAKM
jgi:hypothetical protein